MFDLKTEFPDIKFDYRGAKCTISIREERFELNNDVRYSLIANFNNGKNQYIHSYEHREYACIEGFASCFLFPKFESCGLLGLKNRWKYTHEELTELTIELMKSMIDKQHEGEDKKKLELEERKKIFEGLTETVRWL